ncbi:hypothetical protein D3C80_2184050 [compost metagenome]
MTDLMAEMTQKRSVRLSHRDADRLTHVVIGLRRAQTDQAVLMTGHGGYELSI